MLAHQQLPTEFLPHTTAKFYPTPPPVHAQPNGQDQAQDKVPTASWASEQSQSHQPEISPYESSLSVQPQGPVRGLGLGVSIGSTPHSRQSSGITPPSHSQHTVLAPTPPTAQSQSQLQVDTSGTYSNASNGQYYGAPYSPTPQLTHSSSSNMVQSEHITSPEDIHTLAPPPFSSIAPTVSVSLAAAPPNTASTYDTDPDASIPQAQTQSQVHTQAHSNGNDNGYPFLHSMDDQPYALPVQDQQYWPADAGITAYSMAGAGTYDDPSMYDNMLVKPYGDLDHMSTAGAGEVRNIYSSHSA